MLHWLLHIYCSVSSLDPDVSGTVGCDAQWKSSQYSNSCYKLNQVKLNWTDADAYCKSKGANLVSIKSKYIFVS